MPRQPQPLSVQPRPAGKTSGMDAGLVVVLAVLGRDLPTGHDRVPRWLPALGFGAGVLYLVLGAYGLLVEEPFHRMAVFWLLQGVIFLGVGVGQYLAARRNP